MLESARRRGNGWQGFEDRTRPYHHQVGASDADLVIPVGGYDKITWPHFFDQFLIGRLVVEALRIGVGVGSRCRSFYMGDDGRGGKCGGELTDGGDEGEERRKRAKKVWRGWLTQGYGRRGSPYEN